VTREWVFFDNGVISGELDDLPAKEASKITGLMDHYRLVGRGNPSPALVDDYGDGIKRLRHVKSEYQGRLLFFTAFKTPGFERLVVLTVYKKESHDVPRNVLERAKGRKAQYEKWSEKNG
jgi:phage-related protein